MTLLTIHNRVHDVETQFKPQHELISKLETARTLFAMANYDQRMDYGVSSPSVIKENASFNGLGLADSGFDTFDLSASPTQSHDLDHYPTSVNGHENHSTHLFDPLKPVQENGDPPNLLDMDFFDPLAPLPEEFPSPENTSSPNLMDEQLLEYGERDSSTNGSITASPVDFFSRTVDPDASLVAGRTSSTASEDGGSMSEGHAMPSGSLSKERDSGAECDSIDDEVQQHESPILLPSIYQRDDVDNHNEHESEHDHLHDANISWHKFSSFLHVIPMGSKKKELEPQTTTSHLEIKVKRSKTEVTMRIVPEAEKENVNLQTQNKVALGQKEKENVIHKQITVVQKEQSEVSPIPDTLQAQDLPEIILDGDQDQFLDSGSNENISDDEMKENISTGVSVNHLKSSFTNGFDHVEEDENNEKEVIITGVDIRTLRENYCQNTQIEDADKGKEKIETGISIKDLKTSYVAASRFQDLAVSQRARSMGDLTREQSRTSEFSLGVSVEALRASYCDLIKLDETKVRERQNINTGVSIKSLKTSFISNSNETPNNETPGVKIDRAKITRSFSQETYPLYALLDAYDGCFSHIYIIKVLTRDEQSNLCRICGRPVFLMDRIKAEKSVFHRTCFRCKECNKQLTVDSYCSHETVLYCKLHFKQLFQPKVNFEEQSRTSRRKNEDPIKENIPMELPPDVIRYKRPQLLRNSKSTRFSDKIVDFWRQTYTPISTWFHQMALLQPMECTQKAGEKVVLGGIREGEANIEL
uniref:LIM zinc-binding domain-containing protein n=1 Tax=Strigamia maritima TaxID=126957 RepID=T1JBG3_STRMM